MAQAAPRKRISKKALPKQRRTPAVKAIREPKPAIDPIDDDRRVALERQLRASKSAFASFDTAQDRTDKALYQAIGRLAEFVAVVGNDHDSLVFFAKEHSVKVTKATSTHVAVAKLVTSDGKKASKYATVLQFAALRGIASEADAVAEFIGEQGGIEACLRAYRETPREGSARPGAGRPSAYSQAVSKVAGIARVPAPQDLSVSAMDDGYFVMVGVRDADGALHFIQQPVTDEKLIKAAVTSIGKAG